MRGVHPHGFRAHRLQKPLLFGKRRTAPAGLQHEALLRVAQDTAASAPGKRNHGRAEACGRHPVLVENVARRRRRHGHVSLADFAASAAQHRRMKKRHDDALARIPAGKEPGEEKVEEKRRIQHGVRHRAGQGSNDGPAGRRNKALAPARGHGEILAGLHGPLRVKAHDKALMLHLVTHAHRRIFAACPADPGPLTEKRRARRTEHDARRLLHGRFQPLPVTFQVSSSLPSKRPT